VGAVVVYLAASQGPVVAELLHHVDHAVRGSASVGTDGTGPGAERSHTGRSHTGAAWAPDPGHSHGRFLDGVLAAVVGSDPGEVPLRVPPVASVALHLPGRARESGEPPATRDLPPSSPRSSPPSEGGVRPPTPPPRG
jgi:hypothetical protein